MQNEFDGMTPGPWKYPEVRPTIEAMVCGEMQTIATCLTLVRWDAKRMGYIDTRAERDANARAIAALPDIIARLKKAEAERDRWKDTAGKLMGEHLALIADNGRRRAEIERKGQGAAEG